MSENIFRLSCVCVCVEKGELVEVKGDCILLEYPLDLEKIQFTS